MSMSVLESIAIRAYAAIGIHEAVFDLPPVRAHALRLVRRLLVSGLDPDDCTTIEMNEVARAEIRRLAEALRTIDPWAA